MARARILVLGFTPTANDPRILRHIAALRPEFDVISMGLGPAPAGVIEHIELPVGAHHLPRTPAGLAALAMRRYQTAYDLVPVVRAIRDLAPQASSFDAVVANDLITLPVALDLAEGKPVVGDMHEYEPRQFEELWRWRVALQGFYTYWCRESLKLATALVTVAPGIADEYERAFGVQAAVVMNAAHFAERQPHATRPSIRLVHSGQAMVSRHIHTMIAAADGIPDLTLDLLLTTTTQGDRYLQQLKRQADRTANVRVLNPVPMSALAETLASYDVGLSVLYPSSFNILHALPNKFFDFVQARLGLIVGPSPEMAAIVQQHQLGVVTDGFEVDAIRATLVAVTPSVVDEWKHATDRAARALSAEEQAVIFRDVVRSALES